MPVEVLIVDDHQMMREGLRRMLGEAARLKVVGEAADSATAWEAIVKLKPKLVLLDLQMPGEGGLALLRRIHSAFAEIKVLVLTGQLEPGLARQALAAGAAGYLLKTNGGLELLNAVECVLAGKIYSCTDTTTALLRSSETAPASANKVALSAREEQVLQHVVAGRRNKEIAAAMNLGIKSVETYRARLMKKLGCATPAELVRHALQHGLVKL